MSVRSHDEWLQFAIARMKKVRPPLQSNFRVYAIITYETKDGELDFISGTNSECAFIGSSLCAERSAAVRLREIAGANVKNIYLVSDLSDEYLSPGLLCREYLLSCAGGSDVTQYTWPAVTCP